MDCQGFCGSAASREDSRIRFVESPRSPFRRSRRSLSHFDQSLLAEKRSVGSLTKVNTQVRYEGLLASTSMEPLISERDICSKMFQISNTTTKKENDMATGTDNTFSREATLIELAYFPGYFSHQVTPLPHGLHSLQHMQMITKGQKFLFNKHGFLLYWEKNFYSIPSQNIMHDVFWWFFLHYYQPNQPIQNLLFTRVAENYVLLLSNMAPSHYHDIFFEYYPEVLVQSVYSIYVYCFPNSWSSFDESFKSDLCNTIFLWFTGTQRRPGKWKEWNFENLEPHDLIKYIKTNDQTNALKHKSFNIDQLIEEARTEAKPMHLPKQHKNSIHSQMQTAIQGFNFGHAVMDIKCSSPLVSHFLRNQGAFPLAGCSLLLQHVVFHKQPDKECTTFSEVISKSKEHDKMVHSEFDKCYNILRAHMKKHQRERKILSQEHKMHTTLLLSHRQEIRRLSNNLAFNILGTQSDKSRKDKISSAIKDSILRLS
ncbi:PREDICTED: protein FAM227B-like isoform X1 [Amphimedon queenslandica]|uniref:Uncharacterized protein n=1 Tax=Amphimedon queenslandica TaxID=400682 RepID=A0AAN0J091_AMPQE|nr:PREDICTED: protein FAM227B-like isoform X1 [Amphimedon queenslandica]|eukprot:XP_019850429.1 PREDICTED: protein FAM227B-like isoform X1 [Amphimedon queenslandica]